MKSRPNQTKTNKPTILSHIDETDDDNHCLEIIKAIKELFKKQAEIDKKLQLLTAEKNG